MTAPAAPAGTAPRRGRTALLALLAFAFVATCALGTWQVQRLGWKRDLIARVDARLATDPVPAPPRDRWLTVTREGDEYRRVVLEGEWIAGRDTRTQAVTELDAGHWVLSPLRLASGDVVLVNRGFVPARASADPVPAGTVRVTGLLRISEPGGGFLRENRPAEDRWYSRDVAAIAAARGIGAAVAPYFVDADADAGSDRWPRGGMTVVRFRDNHLSYAVTWFGLALLSLVGAALVLKRGRR